VSETLPELKPAQAESTDVVGSLCDAGVFRYRVWPAKRHPVAAILTAVLTVAATALTVEQTGSTLWASYVFVGLVLTAGLFFFPNHIAFDGYMLHRRAYGFPRTWDLRRFRKMEVSTGPVAHVELKTHATSPIVSHIKSVIVALPPNSSDAEQVVAHIRRWIGKRPTGSFELDEDHAPQDVVRS
jgi:hypothetical protein